MREDKTERSPKKKEQDKRKVPSVDSVTSIKSTDVGKELSFSQANLTTPARVTGDVTDGVDEGKALDVALIDGALEGEVIQSKFTQASTASPWWDGVRSSKPSRVESLESIEETKPPKSTTSPPIDQAAKKIEVPTVKPIVKVMNLTPSSARPKSKMEDPAGSSIRDPASVRERAKEYNDQHRKAFLSSSKHESEDKDDANSLESPRKWKEESEHKSPQASPQNKRPMKSPPKEVVVVAPLPSPPVKEVVVKPPMVKHRWKPPPKPIMTWLKKASKKGGDEGEPKKSQAQSVNRLYGQHFKTQAKLEDARYRYIMFVYIKQILNS